MQTHKLKTDPAPFADVWLGTKKAELRVNDRDYKIGDRLELQEQNIAHVVAINHQITAKPTGRVVVVVVSHIVEEGYGLRAGYVMLSFSPIDKRDDN